MSYFLFPAPTITRRVAASANASTDTLGSEIFSKMSLTLDIIFADTFEPD